MMIFLLRKSYLDRRGVRVVSWFKGMKMRNGFWVEFYEVVVKVGFRFS